MSFPVPQTMYRVGNRQNITGYYCSMVGARSFNLKNIYTVVPMQYVEKKTEQEQKLYTKCCFYSMHSCYRINETPVKLTTIRAGIGNHTRLMP